MRNAFLLAALPLALAACQQEKANEPAPETSQPALPVEASTTPAPATSSTAGIPEGGIPVALQGNWGMVPADCTSTRGDNKGLLRITATTLQFYESLARLGAIKDRSENALTADFEFTGEGMTWNREETLAVSGDTLTRTERGGDEPGTGGPFTYTKCAA
jgi:hypothetical protein